MKIQPVIVKIPRKLTKKLDNQNWKKNHRKKLKSNYEKIEEEFI